MNATTAQAQPATRSATTMRAAVVVVPGEVQVREAPLPQPGPRQVRVRLEGCGVCASNIPPWEGREWFTYPMPPGALGHEGWGVVDALGAGVTAWRVGDRVAALSQNAYADYDVADEHALVRLPPMLNGRPFPAEPLGCAMNILHRSCILAGQTVAIVGVGFMGALLVRLAATVGARVVAISRRPTALEMARCMGAACTIPMDEHRRIIEQVGSLTGGRLCEVVIEAAGKQWPLDLAGELTAERGRLVIAGYHQDGLRQVNMQQWNWRGIDVINAHERDPAIYVAGMRNAVEAVAAGKLDPSPLCTHSFALEQLPQALAMTRDRPDGFMKALIRM